MSNIQNKLWHCWFGRKKRMETKIDMSIYLFLLYFCILLDEKSLRYYYQIMIREGGYLPTWVPQSFMEIFSYSVMIIKAEKSTAWRNLASFKTELVSFLATVVQKNWPLKYQVPWWKVPLSLSTEVGLGQQRARARGLGRPRRAICQLSQRGNSLGRLTFPALLGVFREVGLAACMTSFTNFG